MKSSMYSLPSLSPYLLYREAFLLTVATAERPQPLLPSPRTNRDRDDLTIVIVIVIVIVTAAATAAADPTGAATAADAAANGVGSSLATVIDLELWSDIIAYYF